MPAGHSCCIVGCTSSSHNWKGEKLNNGLSFYRIPKVKTSQGSQVEEMTTMRRRAWLAAIRRPSITFENSSDGMRVCSRHFHSGKSLTVFWPALLQYYFSFPRENYSELIGFHFIFSQDIQKALTTLAQNLLRTFRFSSFE